jgi:hypothetical protein
MTTGAGMAFEQPNHERDRLVLEIQAQHIANERAKVQLEVEKIYLEREKLYIEETKVRLELDKVTLEQQKACINTK